jgi:hypothetical protein
MLTIDFIGQYLTDNPPKHDLYEGSVKIAQKLRVHEKGEYPASLIEIARPNEDEKYKEYRREVFTPITKTVYSKVVSTIAKINRAEDWKIGFADDSSDLKNYTEEIYPYFDSLENWFFSIGLNQMLKDPNSVVAVIPLTKKNPTDDSEQFSPFTFIFKAENVIDYEEGRYAVLMAEEKSMVTQGDTQVKKGKIIYFIDHESYIKAVQVGELTENQFQFNGDEMGNINPTMHNFEYMPAWKMGGTIEEFIDGEMLYDSFIGDCIPYWDEALRRYSDHQVNMVLHLHPMEWEIQDTPCPTCKATGSIRREGRDGTPYNEDCRSCAGAGNVSAKTPFGRKLINVSKLDGVNQITPIPTPPAGIIERDIASISFLKQEVKDNIKDGLAAVNMEFIMETPEINSGVAKAMDRQEMNSFFYNIARHVVNNILYPAYYFISAWRDLSYSEEQIIASMPTINTPTKFDVLSSDILANRLTIAKTAGLPASLTNAMQKEYAETEFGDDSDETILFKLVSDLDPLPGLIEADKMTVLSNKGTTQAKYILSSNIYAFVFRARIENKTFEKMPYANQMDILDAYVQEVVDENEKDVVPMVQLAPDPNNPNPVDPQTPAVGDLKATA